jgi:hypothetical protein
MVDARREVLVRHLWLLHQHRRKCASWREKLMLTEAITQCYTRLARLK